jgi:hypothetical protein
MDTKIGLIVLHVQVYVLKIYGDHLTVASIREIIKQP